MHLFKKAIVLLRLLSITAGYLLLVQPAGAQHNSNVDYVDPFICTAGDHGQLSPAATLPFGMVKLGPDTYPTNHSGYDYTASQITGFTINRVEGAGCKGAGGNLLLQPGTGELTMKPMAYDKASEKATPGFYTVTYKEPAITTELTVTNNTGIERFTFPQSKRSFVGIDFAASYAGFISEAHYKNADDEITGWLSAKNVCDYGAYKLYYSITCSKPFGYTEDANTHKAWLTFATRQNEQVIIKVSISAVSIEDARKERYIQTNSYSFNELKEQAHHKWEKTLSGVNVIANDTIKTLFYTHLYHAYLSPIVASGTDHVYKGTDGQLHKTTGFNYYHSWSVWDNFRTSLPLISITQPAVFTDITRSLALLYEQGKYAWAGNEEPSPTVRTERSGIVLLDAWNKGFRNFSFQKIYDNLQEEATALPQGSPDNRLEASYDYWAMATIAGITGHEKDRQRYLALSGAYKSTWSSVFRQPDSSTWDVMHGAGLYEGTIWQYRWFVPHDIAGIITLAGGTRVFNQQLDTFFGDRLYNHGNQPDIQVPFLYNYTGASWKTQQLVNSILTKDFIQCYGTHKRWDKPYTGKLYKAEPDGFIEEMDDDVGTMSAWYVLASLGIYPALVGQPIYTLSSPLFKHIQIQLPGKKSFTIACNNYNPDTNVFIAKATLNGKPLLRNWITYQEIMKGGRLVFDMSPTPNTNWGNAQPYIPALPH